MEEAKAASKTRDLEFHTFFCQRYLQTNGHILCQEDSSSSVVYDEVQGEHEEFQMSCRAGCLEAETQDHLLNCQNIHGDVRAINISVVKNSCCQERTRRGGVGCGVVEYIFLGDDGN